jgi:hypothetical protein
MDAPTIGGGGGGECKTSSYVIPMVIVLILLIGIVVFVVWYYLGTLKPRLSMLIADKKSGAVGFQDSSGAQLLLQPSLPSTGLSSRIAVLHKDEKLGLNFSLGTQPIPNNTKQQVQFVIANPNGSQVLPLTTV